MLENIVAGVISGLITAIVLELVKRAIANREHRSRQIQKPVSSNTAAPMMKLWLINAGRTISKGAVRLVVSTLLGYSGAFLTAGLLEENGYPNILIGSATFYVLISSWTIAVWFVLLRYAAKKPVDQTSG